MFPNMGKEAKNRPFFNGFNRLLPFYSGLINILINYLMYGFINSPKTIGISNLEDS